ncbi:NB-ARC domain-containing protein [Streptomyces sp. NBC_00094]|uniref:ATP-binding protein n=1 Tax=Streptomyces sp. NBC_00094 TaxID=2903620 RepID=UPI00225579C4|nr:NB-ARC domain-containing protein [Streptomyces sp. NBC_00094]MCX5389233.1 NB-ARC domain-containing protein [Streptomyces sp. NBC_00094]
MEELAALAMAGVTTVFGLVVTDAWEQAKSRDWRLFGRRGSGGDAGQVAGELEEAGREAASARAAGDETEARAIEERWGDRLLQVLRDDPRAVAELQDLIAAFGPPTTTTYISGDVNHGPAFQGARIRGDMTFHVHQAPAPSPVPSEPPPDQVPELTAAFVNRTADLGELDRWFPRPGASTAAGARAPRVGIGVLHGLPGVGKTATAWHWAASARERYPDGQLYVDFAALRGQSGGDVSEAVAMCLRSLGVTDDYMPRTLQERAALFRSRTAERRLLVVLDDVGQPAQVRPLVPKGPGSAVLVTSQSALGELALDGARTLALRPLDRDGALLLLAEGSDEETVAADPAAAERLVELCGGLPVALRIVGARLRTDPGLTAAALARELADENRRLDGMSLGGAYSMSAVLNPTYRLLPAGAARLYRYLGWHPCRTYDVDTAAAALGATAADTAPLLGRLAEDGLIERTSDGRYRMHDLVRLHARERADAEEPPTGEATLVGRVLTHCLVRTALADRAIRADRLRVADLDALLAGVEDPFAAPEGNGSRPNAPSGARPAPPSGRRTDPLSWLESRSADLLDVLRAGAAQDGLDTLVWQLAEAYTVLFLHQRALGPWRESLELGARAAARAVAPAAEARLRSLLSRPLLDLGEDERARAELDAALACAEIAGHTVLSASVREFDGRYWDRHDPARAVDAYRASLDLNIRAGEARGAGIATYFLGCAQDAAEEHTTALATLRAAHRMLSECRDPRMAARATAALGIAHDHLGDAEEAMRALEDAAGVLRAERATHYEAQALVALADIAERTGARRDEVPEWLDRAARVHEAGGSPLAPVLRERLRALGAADEAGSEG